jgi:hypothetical protein
LVSVVVFVTVSPAVVAVCTDRTGVAAAAPVNPEISARRSVTLPAVIVTAPLATATFASAISWMTALVGIVVRAGAAGVAAGVPCSTSSSTTSSVASTRSTTVSMRGLPELLAAISSVVWVSSLP